jgi:NADH:ubiquinone oxidoreductase subunit 4 (subunit M)
MMLILMLWMMCGIMVLPVVVMVFMDFDYYFLLLFEMYTVLFFLIISNLGSSFERGGSLSYIIFYRYLLGFGVVMLNSLVIIGIVLLLLGIAKLPVYGLHIWLPKVHVEASIVGSIVLAGAVLKLGIIYMWNFRGIMLFGIVVVISVVIMLGVIDGKRFAAYSSVSHMTLCVIFCLYVMLLVGYIHIILSPLIFITVYGAYMISGSRFFIKNRIMIIILWMINFGVPFIRSFFSEVYIIGHCGVILLILVIMYLIIGFVIIKSLNMDGKGVFYIPFAVLYVLMI